MKPYAIFSALLSLAVGFGALALPTDVDARRLGGGGGAGMQRAAPPRAQPTTPPGTPATPAAPAATPGVGATAAAAPAAAAKRSWMGPIAGIAAGLGIAALFSALGLGAGLANFITLLLLGVAAFLVIRFLIRRFAGGGALGAGAGRDRMAYAGQAPADRFDPRRDAPVAPLARFEPAPVAPAGAAAPVSLAPAGVAPIAALPADFDAEGFARIAKMIFIRLQAANDAGDLDDLRRFTTPEMYAAVRLELQERGNRSQQTDVVQIDAEVLDVAQEQDRQIVTVRFSGLIREEQDAAAAPFDELWHFARPLDGSREWAIAGIQQAVAA